MSKIVVKVFSATMARERERLGETVTEWLTKNPEVAVDEIRTMQSSDQSFHCCTFVIFGKGKVTWQPPLPEAQVRR